MVKICLGFFLAIVLDVERGTAEDCARQCSSYATGASPASEFVCMDTSSGKCGDESACSDQVGISHCRQPASSTGACIGAASGCWSLPALPELAVKQQIAYRTVTYGKYYKGSCNDNHRANSFTVFHDESARVPQKTIIEIHGGSLVGGSMRAAPDGEIQAYVREGFTYISLDYRLVDNRYFFRDCAGQEREEEYIAVSLDGALSIPSVNDPLTIYQIQVGGQEFMTKGLYDVVQAMDLITSRAGELMVDVTAVGFHSRSFGVALANYLIWTYPRLYPGRYEPVSATFQSAQLDYTVQNMLDKTYGIFVEELGESALLKDYLVERDCDRIVGNPACSSSLVDQAHLCNASWHNLSVESFCGPNFENATFGRLSGTQVWQPKVEQDRGLAYLWHVSSQMRAYQPSDFVLYIVNMQGGASGAKSSYDMVHHAMYAKTYGDLCVELGIDCVVYYAPWFGIRSSSRGIDMDGLDFKETFSWRESPYGSAASPATAEEMLQIHLYAADRNTDETNFYVSGCNVHWLFHVAILVAVSADRSHGMA